MELKPAQTKVEDGRLIRPDKLNHKEKLEYYLKQIGWSLTRRGQGWYDIVDHLKQNSSWQFKHDHIEQQVRHGVGQPFVVACYYLKDCRLELLDGMSVCVSAKDPDPNSKHGTQSVYIMFRNPIMPMK